jgi:hypothetical protein
MRHSRNFRWLTVGLLFAGLLYGAGLVLTARSPAPAHECVSNRTGASRVVPADGQCAGGETFFTGTR